MGESVHQGKYVVLTIYFEEHDISSPEWRIVYESCKKIKEILASKLERRCIPFTSGGNFNCFSLCHLTIFPHEREIKQVLEEFCEDIEFIE